MIIPCCHFIVNWLLDRSHVSMPVQCSAAVCAGLFGSPANWTTIVEKLQLAVDTQQVRPIFNFSVLASITLAGVVWTYLLSVTLLSY